MTLRPSQVQWRGTASIGTRRPALHDTPPRARRDRAEFEPRASGDRAESRLRAHEEDAVQVPDLAPVRVQRCLLQD